MVNTIFMQEGIWDLEKLDISVSEPGFKARSAFLEISKPVLTNKIKCYLPRWFCFLVATSSKVQLRNRQIFNFNNKPNIFKKLFQYTLSIKIIILHFFLWSKSLLNSHIWLVATMLLDSVVLNEYAQLPIKTSLTTGIFMQHEDTLSVRLYSTQAPHQISYPILYCPFPGRLHKLKSLASTSDKLLACLLLAQWKPIWQDPTSGSHSSLSLQQRDLVLEKLPWSLGFTVSHIKRNQFSLSYSRNLKTHK